MATITKSDKKRILALIKKVKVLSVSGVQGEQINAQAMLTKLLKKYNLSNFNLLHKPKKRTFSLSNYNDCRVIMTHCILDTAQVEIAGTKQKKQLYCNLTDEQYIDVCQKFNHYYPIYYTQIQQLEKQKDIILKAFLIKNNLGIVDDGDQGSDVCGELSDIPEISIMMSEVEEKRYIKKNLKQLQSC